MLLKADAKALEWRVKAYLAQDRIAMEEILQNEIDGISIHTINQKSLGLPSKLIAKIFAYRMIFADAFGDNGFAGPAFAYANDPDFQGTSKSVKFWQNIVEKFFNKYEGMYEHSIQLIRTASSTGKIENLSGRTYRFTPYLKRGTPEWPRTKILNYPIQGLSADFIQLARIALYRRLSDLEDFGTKILLINTVHDDVELDVDNDPELVYNISIILEKVFADIPEMVEKTYGTKVNVPMGAEVKFGLNLDENSMKLFDKKSFYRDWNIFWDEQERISQKILSKK